MKSRNRSNKGGEKPARFSYRVDALTYEIELKNQDEAIKLFGRNGELRRKVQDKVPVRIVDRGMTVQIHGEAGEAEIVKEMFSELLVAVRNGHTPTLQDVDYTLNEVRNRRSHDLGAILGEVPSVLRQDIFVKPRTRGQRMYLDMLRHHELVVVTGPAGTGKTYLGMAAAISALVNKEVDRLVLTRPAVEAGENLGFLPGDLREKVNPYLQPLYDCLYAMLEADQVQKYFDREQIEVAPLAFMRGRTLSRSFIILDEAQNATAAQMKMFLTRLGEGSRALVTGDVTQIDLPSSMPSGLIEAQRILRTTKGVAMVELTKDDVVRHELVQRIVDAYETDERDGRQASSDRRSQQKAETETAAIARRRNRLTS